MNTNIESEFGICVCEMNGGKLFRSKKNTYQFFVQDHPTVELTAQEAYLSAKAEGMRPAMDAILKDNPHLKGKQ
jgi:hypothetical protein